MTSDDRRDQIDIADLYALLPDRLGETDESYDVEAGLARFTGWAADHPTTHAGYGGGAMGLIRWLFGVSDGDVDTSALPKRYERYEDAYEKRRWEDPTPRAADGDGSPPHSYS